MACINEGECVPQEIVRNRIGFDELFLGPAQKPDS